MDVNINITDSKPKTVSEPIEDISIAPTEPIKDETEIQIAENVLKTEPFEQEVKHSKKKNKKKKRHDSDRSDKSGDALLCTAAFQKLLDDSDEKPTDGTEDREGDSVKEKLIEDNLLAVTEDDKGPSLVVDDTQNISTPETEKHIDVTPEVHKFESKKKKNKKDKKNPPKSEEIDVLIPVESSKSSEPVRDTKMPDEIIQTQATYIEAESLKDITEVISSENIELDTQSENTSKDVIKASKVQVTRENENVDIIPKDDSIAEISKPDKGSPKPKAKIAKPVDKKRKGKQESTDVSMSEGVSTTLESLILEQPSTVITTPDVPDIIQKENILDTPELKEIFKPTQQSITDICEFTASKEETKLDTFTVEEQFDQTAALQRTDNIIAEAIGNKSTIQHSAEEQKYVPIDNKTGKKKRKPLKMPIPSPVEVEPIQTLEEMTTELSKEGKDIGDVESIFETLVPTDIEVKATDQKLDEILELKVESQGETVDTNSKSTEHPEEQWIKPKRRGKKSLKMPPTPGVRDEQFNLNIERKNEERAKEPEITVQQSPIETLEIRSVKADDSECSPCDVTPDIVYPRSTSQLNIDNNNNTVICEISLPDTLNIPVGLTSPLIQGSGETPIGTPIMVSSFNITEMESPTEKTDLKSKVIEVNQEMEELRLSIERSLAELTAMEKSEQELEKQYEETHSSKVEITTSEKELSKPEDIQTTKKESIDLQINPEYIPPAAEEIPKETKGIAPLAVQEDDKDLEIPKESTDSKLKKEKIEKPPEKTQCAEAPPICPARRDNKGKGKKRKGKQEVYQSTTTQTSAESSKDKREEKTEQKTETQEQSKQETKQKDSEILPGNDDVNTSDPITDVDYDPIEKFEDALGSSPDDVDVNKTFEMILSEVTDSNQKELASNKPDINITAPEEDFREANVPQPKNLLGHPNIPVSSNKDDFKKEKHKKLNTKQAKVKIKDANDIECMKESKQSQTKSKKASKDFLLKNSNENGDFIYKYSFRKVFLQNTCHVCAKELSSIRVPCNFCNLLFYCSIKHKDEDWPQHQALCFAISTIVHVKDQKHIYAEAKNITGQNYRLLRMQMILSCEKVLKRRLVPWEQEALLYPRICADVRCREWRQTRLKDCEGCGQISYCANSLDHLPLSHQRWCKSYALYQKLVTYQQTKGRLEPKLPTKVMTGDYEIPEKINEVLASMYEEEIDMNDIQYAALTQIATAPLTVAYSHQLYRKVSKPSTNGIFKKSSFVIHVLGAELQFEADVLNKWEVFFLHLRPDVTELVVVLISSNLNPGNLPLDLLGKIRLCENCHQNKRRVIFSFQDKLSYQEYRTSDDFIYPDIVCAFNASINRSSYYPKDQWPGIISSVMRLRSPFLITSHTPTELHRDLIKVKECGEVKVMVEPQRNYFASVRPDRNFITDDETPLLFKNQCFAVLCGV
ncbi:hypothetical protein O3G_MSEX007328 [Manduca sexta]|uniref:MYND-type domain-containing protein n=1 Tax=Manduca sexta TaxID=7130 RepID=A0A921Z5G3_MANSE|nr:hypothetical protein O3G_MSEX007328 [Manduca sexta]